MLRSALTRRRRARGMTLIEIIVVITILSLLMAAVGVAVIPQLEQAKVDRAKMDIGNIQNALKTYYAKKGNYPDTGLGLKALVDAQILERVPVDPWETEYVYMKEGSTPVIISYGKDKAPGGAETDADISSKDLGGKKQ
ncbi:MAG: prepilin-type N-terminal cleavage/methylation domain-containing protein [Archangiaceae bacterium]|nr:prepilin-type N-terminal cleavage/methylation domain-containing protein [Archangiaceae bacterium]